jgi:hypothetical protein
MSITEKHTNGSKIAYFSMEIGTQMDLRLPISLWKLVLEMRYPHSVVD